MGRLFGTDGVRGLGNGDLTPELALSVAVAAAHVLAESDGSHRPVAVVGRDPRASGEMLEAAVIAGLTSAGADVLRVGVLPTPAVAHLTADTGADLGVMLSASHNPMPDNGVKLFARGGAKLPDQIEDQIEARLAEAWQRPTGSGNWPAPPTGMPATCCATCRIRSTACGSSSTARTGPRRWWRPTCWRRQERRSSRSPRRRTV